jgi:adenosine deaminase/aminodeoxyfutalosine deaminase
MTQATAGNLRSLPKAELHLHLEGSVDLETLRELDPALSPGEIEAALAYSDFSGFIQSYVWVNRKLRGPADYGLIARRLFQRLDREGVRYAEITLSAGVILWKKQDLDAIFRRLVEEAAQSPLPIRWILDATRQWGVEAAAPVFDFAAEHREDGVVAIGLGGFEDQGPATWYRELYAKARDRGLRLTCHAGETTDPQSIWDALDIGAERIGHGIRAIEDPRLVDHLRRNSIPLEVCITSNLRTGATPSLGEHPVRRLFDAEVPIVLNTDDPDLFGCTLTGEYALAADAFGFSPEELDRLAQNSFQYAFSAASEPLGALR